MFQAQHYFRHKFYLAVILSQFTNPKLQHTNVITKTHWKEICDHNITYKCILHGAYICETNTQNISQFKRYIWRKFQFKTRRTVEQPGCLKIQNLINYYRILIFKTKENTLQQRHLPDKTRTLTLDIMFTWSSSLASTAKNTTKSWKCQNPV